jgi:hypothetical protein
LFRQRVSNSASSRCGRLPPERTGTVRSRGGFSFPPASFVRGMAAEFG